MVKILTTSTKVQKGEKRGYMTAIAYLSPATESGKSLCPWCTPGCAAACLGHSSGRLALPQAKANRLSRSKLFLEDRGRFFCQLLGEINEHVALASSRGMKAAVRINGSSDIPWERVAPEIFSTFQGVRFYDYTKSFDRVQAFLGGKLSENYHLTFSLAETEKNRREAELLLKLGANVAVVFEALPRTFWGAPVINGEADDLRFLDPRGVVVGLRAKGAAIKDATGFVVRIGQSQRVAA